MLNLSNRRQFFSGALSAIPFRLIGGFAAEAVMDDRRQTALNIRQRTASLQHNRTLASAISNGDEDALPGRIGCFVKGLPQNRFGEVEPSAYGALLAAMKSGRLSDFEQLPRGGGRKLSNPQAAFSYHLEGGDPHTFDIPPAPSIRSDACAFDNAELYWQALCRDVPFSDYPSSLIVKEASQNLSSTPAAVFRGSTKGDLAGPYISQFLLKPIPFGSGHIEQRYKTPVAGSDFMNNMSEWSQMQLGFQPWLSAPYDPTPRYIRNGRDLSEYAHYDFAYQAYLGAALILINANAKSVLNCNQFKSGNNPYRYSTVEDGFATFGPAEAADWIGRVTTAALKAAFYQKWMVHRRVRPEALGGYIHQTRTGIHKHSIHESILYSRAVDAVHKQTGSYFLPQTYPEGSPMHPSYPSGHAAIAGACSVVLKACFDGAMLLPNCVEPCKDGLSLQPCDGYFPTVADEINKLVSNVSMGRDWAGIHFRSDTTAGLLLGEDVGISILQDMARTYTEEFQGFTFERLDATKIHITPRGELIIDRMR